MSNLYFIGMRGVGKTTIAKQVAEKLQKSFLDLDEEIIRQEGESISEMVEKKGWEYFRKKEEELVDQVSEMDNAVISTGGGVLMFYDNAEKLKASGFFILLTAKPETLFERIVDEMADRPALSEKDLREELEDLWKERKEVYYEYADLVIETDRDDPSQISQRILKSLPPSKT